MARHTRRDCSIQLQLSSGANVFEYLKSLSINPADHLTAVQALPGGKVDVTFLSEDVKRRFWPTISSSTNVTATSYADTVKVVSVLHVPHELNDNAVRFVLGKFGKVICGRFLTHRDYPSLYNGVRQYKMELTTDIPSSLNLGGRDCWVRYAGQPRTCLKCGKCGHEAKECDVTKCYKCLQFGHVVRNCTADQKCTTCGKPGHSFRNCPVSFSNKLKCSTAWIRGGAEVAEEQQIQECGVEKGCQSVTQEKTSLVSSDAIDDVTTSDDSTEVIPETPTDFTLSGMEGESVLQDLVSGQCWADSQPDTPAQEPDLMDVQVDVHHTPATKHVKKGSDEDMSPFIEVRRGLKRPPSSPPRRSRSLPRFTPAVQRARDIVRASNVITEEKPWYECPSNGCSMKFRSFRDALCHLKDRHPGDKPQRFQCPLRMCATGCNSPSEWANHLATKHPDFVTQHDVHWFDTYFLLDV
ncbi:uncharacterized protein [Apostichopus japonicus]|uniref:uncharacterized protein n=1 Tax=Stichopus japonicus TaxID=307972 RepID=UPI003AB440FF